MILFVKLNPPGNLFSKGLFRGISNSQRKDYGRCLRLKSQRACVQMPAIRKRLESTRGQVVKLCCGFKRDLSAGYRCDEERRMSGDGHNEVRKSSVVNHAKKTAYAN